MNKFAEIFKKIIHLVLGDDQRNLTASLILSCSALVGNLYLRVDYSLFGQECVRLYARRPRVCHKFFEQHN